MGSLFSSKTPKVQPVQRMPDEQDPAVLEAKRRAAAAVTARSGRSSTIMTARQQAAAGGAGAGSAPATGGAYQNSLLGQAK